MASKLKEVLTALHQELLIEYVDEEQLSISREEFNYILITRVGLADPRTHTKYWNLLRTVRILESKNQYKGGLFIEEFRKVFKQIAGGTI